jgi:hypothetical protein
MFPDEVTEACLCYLAQKGAGLGGAEYGHLAEP